MFRRRITLILFALTISTSGCIVNAQHEDATLVFKRPHVGLGDNHTSRIHISGKEVCSLDSNADKIAVCSTKVRSGEVAIKVSSFRGSDFDYVIDVAKNTTYTFVVYLRNIQTNDMIWDRLSVVKNKVKESDDYNQMSFKIQLIHVERL